ncbi:MAG: YDG domain-containing protein [Clostridiales bacterium]|nr:YDG domain-containing protein [Clostridiales bacterium]
MYRIAAWTLAIALAFTMTPLTGAYAEQIPDAEYPVSETEGEGVVGDGGEGDEGETPGGDESEDKSPDLISDTDPDSFNNDELPTSLSPMAEISPLSTDGEHFQFEITTTEADQIFRIPLSGGLNATISATVAAYSKVYNWDIDWGDGESENAFWRSAADNNSVANAANSVGIPHAYEEAGTYTITITPAGVAAGSESVWFAAFGFANNTTGANNAQTNKDMLTKVLSPITPRMTRTPAQLTSGAPSFEWSNTFFGCTNLTMGPDFTFGGGWESIATVGNNFAASMFTNCNGASFNMGEAFNLPQNITTIGNNFVMSMFFGVSGNDFTMNDVFNLPQNLTTVGSSFAMNMFRNVSGTSFTMNKVFNLPRVTTANFYFVSYMFGGVNGGAFMVNDVFTFPALNAANVDLIDVFMQTFNNIGSTPRQNRTATSIINGNPVPGGGDAFSFRATFASSPAFPDQPYIHFNWGGQELNANNVLIVTPAEIVFPTEHYGYDPIAPRTVTVYNYGATAINGVGIALGGADGSSFDISGLSATTIPAGGSVTFTVNPKHGLGLGTYIGNIAVSATSATTVNIPLSFEVVPRELKILNVTADGKFYDGDADVIDMRVRFLGIVGTDKVGIIATGTFSDESAGIRKPVTYGLELSGDDKSNYALPHESTWPTDVRASIWRRVLTVTLDEGYIVTKPYDGTNKRGEPVGSLAVDNIVEGEEYHEDSNPGGIRIVVTPGVYPDINVNIGFLYEVEALLFIYGDGRFNYELAEDIFIVDAEITPVSHSTDDITVYVDINDHATTQTVDIVEHLDLPGILIDDEPVWSSDIDDNASGVLAEPSVEIGADGILEFNIIEGLSGDEDPAIIRVGVVGFANYVVDDILVIVVPTGELPDDPDDPEDIIVEDTVIVLTPGHTIMPNTDFSVTIEAMFTPDEADYDKIVWTVERIEDDIIFDEASGLWGLMVEGEDGEGEPVTKFVGLASIEAVQDGKAVIAKVTQAGLDRAKTMRVRAWYKDAYTATATIEPIPGENLLDTDTEVKVLEPTVTVNKAKKIGASVPILVTQRQRGVEPVITGLSDGELGGLDESRELGATILIEKVEIGRMVSGNFVEMPGMKAAMNPNDDRYLDIWVDPAVAASVKNATTKNVVARVQCKGIEGWVTTKDTFSLRVVQTWPKLTFSTSAPINARFASSTNAELLVRAADGSPASVTRITGQNAAALRFVEIVNPDPEHDPPIPRPILKPVQDAKAGTAKLVATVELDGYHTAAKPHAKNNPTGNDIRTSVRTVNTMPAIKLERTSMPLIVPADPRLAGRDGIEDAIRHDTDSGPALNAARINIVTRNAKTPLESNYKIADVRVSELDSKRRAVVNPGVDVFFKGVENGKAMVDIVPRETMATGGRLWLEVSYTGAGATDVARLSLNLTATNPARLAATIKPNAYTINQRQDGGAKMVDGANIAEFPININAANVSLSDFAVSETTPPKETTKTNTPWEVDGNAPVNFAFGTNSVQLLANQHGLERLARDTRNKKFDLMVGSPSLTTNPFRLRLTFTNKVPGFSVRFGKGNINVTSPDSFRPATIRLTNTTSAIEEVRLFQTNTSASRTVPSRDFATVMTGANTFNVVIKDGRQGHVNPRVAQRLSVEVALENGQVLRSWAAAPNAKGVVADKTISINPAATVPRANPNKLADVMLHLDQPKQGAMMTTLAVDGTRAPIGAQVGHVQIQAASVRSFEKDGFRLERNGTDRWSIFFVEDDRPYLINPKTQNRTSRNGLPTPLKKTSYNVRIEMWAFGTYRLNADGTPMINPADGRVMPYMNANGRKAVTRATTINQRVFIR